MTLNIVSNDYDRQTFLVMDRVLHTKSNCVDVGCHEGQILMRMLKCAPEGRHVAFEPLPELAQQLKLKFSNMTNVTIFSSALSHSAGRANFQHVVTNPAYSGLLRRRYDSVHEEVQQIEVEVSRLDDVLPIELEVNFIKIDVEGGELGVLQGAIKTLQRSRPYIVFEHGLGAADYYGTDPTEVFDLLNEAGYSVSLMIDWLENKGHGAFSREEFSDHFWQHRNYYFIAYPQVRELILDFNYKGNGR